MKFRGKYWFYLEYYVYLRIANGRVLLFNTLDSEYIKSENPAIFLLCEKIAKEKNSGGIEIDFDKYKEKVYHSFFGEIKTKYMGDLIEVDLLKSEPFQFPVSANINNNHRSNNKSSIIDFGLVKKSLITLNIFVNNFCRYNCIDCHEYFKQFHCCTKNAEDKNLPIKYIDQIFGSIKFENLNKINILGGDIYSYKFLDQLFDRLSIYRRNCYAYFNALNSDLINDKILSFFENRIILIIDLRFFQDSTHIIKNNEAFHYFFIIRDEDTYFQSVNYVKIKEIHSYTMVPFFDKKNIDFFTSYVFLSETDILNDAYSIKQILKNEAVNSLFWGELTLYPNGCIYSGIQGNYLGSLDDFSILQLIAKELLSENSYWYLTRDKVSCGNCIYRDLCPPISNYEIIMDRYDLCHIKSLF